MLRTAQSVRQSVLADITRREHAGGDSRSTFQDVDLAYERTSGGQRGNLCARHVYVPVGI